MLKNRKNSNVHCSQCFVNKLCLSGELTNEEKNAVNNIILKIKEVKKNEHVVLIDDPLTNLFAIYSGSCKSYLLNENGVENINCFYFAGDLIGLDGLPDKKYLYSVMALEDSQLCVIPINDLLKLMQHSENILKRYLNITSFKMQNDQSINLHTNANLRIVDFILNIIRRLDERNIYQDYITLPMSQVDISNFLGLAHETVNRILKKLHNDKIIKMQNKTIFINDIKSLKSIAEKIPHLNVAGMKQ